MIILIIKKHLKELEFKNFNTRKEFRSWLQNNHDASPGIWMVFKKKHLKAECINYSEALEEALCFGWIDSIIKKVDEEKYVRKFTPRINTKNWSDINKRLVNELINQGKMTEAGLKKIDLYLKTGKLEWITAKPEKKDIKEPDIPVFIVEELAKNEPALVNFNNLSPASKKMYVLWITNGKREETVQKRLKESTGLLKENKKLGLK